MIGHPAHGHGQLAPDSPRFTCSSCHGHYWEQSDLNEDGECQECVDQDEPGTDYPMDIYTNSADAALNRGTLHGLRIILNP
jgi:hypothetical protein